MVRKKYLPAQHHVRLHDWLLESPAWLSLTPQARAAYISLCKRYFGHNNGQIGLSVRQVALECRMSKDTATKAFDQLIDRGFVERKTPGGFSRKTPHATEWLLTEHRDDVEREMPKKAFMKWGRNSIPGPK